MSNISTEFIKINNEYVKFYATTNTALPDILKNTGAVIIVQDNDKIDELNDHLRSLYIAKNFVAEGHGFSADTVRDYFNSYGEYVEWSDFNGEFHRDRKLSYYLSMLQSGIATNSERMNNYVLTYGGNITETIINAYVEDSPYINQITSKYLTNMLRPAEYNDAKITYIYSYVTYKYATESDETFVSYAENIDKLNFSDKKADRYIEFPIPRGSQIVSTYMYLESENNDTVGFTDMPLIGNKEYYRDTAYTTCVMSEYLTHSMGKDIICNKNDSDEFAEMVNFTAYNLGSIRLKKYPNMPEHIEHYSQENKVRPYSMIIGKIKCSIYDAVRYNKFEESNVVDPINISNYFSRIYDVDNMRGLSYCQLDCSKLTNNGIIYLSVPENYEVLHVEQRKQYERNGITSYYEYNVTGDMFEIERNDSELSYCFNTFDNYYCKCRNYCFKNYVEPTDTVIMALKKITDSEDIILIDSNLEFTNSNCNVTSYFLQDSEYNSTHWLSPYELSFTQNVI